MTRLLCASLWVTAVLCSGAAVFQEPFASDPRSGGWRTFGEASLFHWNASGQNLEVTWDSARTNSFFYRPLGTILSKDDDFSFGFDVRLVDIQTGSTPGKTNEFEIAIGLLSFSSATNVNFFRGAGVSATYGVKNLVEFDYFPDSGFGDTFGSAIVSTNNRIYPEHNFPLTMTLGDTFRVGLKYTASNQLLRTVATRNGVPFGMPPGNTLADLSMMGRLDFRVDSFAVISYSDAIQFGPPSVHGSVLAHGVVDNIEWTVPAAPVLDLAMQQFAQTWQVTFTSRTNWTYILERSLDLDTWKPSSPTKAGNGASLVLADTNAMAPGAFYRIRSERP